MNELMSRVQGPLEQGPTQFRDYLIAEFEARRRINRRYSLRAYARDLQIASSLLSRILNGKVPVTSKMLRRLSSKVTVPPEVFAECVREVREHENKRKESRRRSTSEHSLVCSANRSAELGPQKSRSSYQTASFVIPCNMKLIPQVIREIERFQNSLIDFVNQDGASREPVCELHLSIRVLVEN